jgi:hypothetical protein
LFDNIALNEIKLRDDLSQSVGDLSLADRNWDDLLQVFYRNLLVVQYKMTIHFSTGQW